MTLAIWPNARQGHRTAPSSNIEYKENGRRRAGYCHRQSCQPTNANASYVPFCSKAASLFKICNTVYMYFTSERPDAERSAQEKGPSTSSTASVWDSLSNIWLTKLALNELDRKNRSTRPRKHYLRPLPVAHGLLARRRRPLIRRFLAELRRDIQLQNTPASDFLRTCSSAALGDVQAFARHGGPDLLDLGGVHTKTF